MSRQRKYSSDSVMSWWGVTFTLEALSSNLDSAITSVTQTSGHYWWYMIIFIALLVFQLQTRDDKIGTFKFLTAYVLLC